MSDERPQPDDAARSDRAIRAVRLDAPGGPQSSLPPDPGHPGGPGHVLRQLLDGNHRFHSGLPRHGYDVVRARNCAERPSPAALMIGCIDSRVPPEAVFDQGVGDLLVVRTAGHVLDSAAMASLELAVGKMGVALVVVLGHQSCAAVEYAVDAVHRGVHPGGDLGYLVDQITPSVPMSQGLAGTQQAYQAVRNHLAATVDTVRAVPTVAAAALTVATVGVLYDVTDGRAELTVPPE